jgi:Subtilase family
MINLPQTWALLSSIPGKTVTAAVIDSGVDATHPDLKNKLLATSGSTIGGTFSLGVTDLDGHGTHVAGTIAADTNNGIGVAGVAGYASGAINVRLLGIRAGDNGFAITDLVTAINYVVNQKADVLNMSLGTYGISDSLRDTVATAVASGLTIVSSAGNASNSLPHFPSDYPGVIKVSALGPTKKLASYSNFGGPVAIAAPGGDTALRGQAADGVYSTFPVAGSLLGRNYGFIEGTSMASPHVAGVCALLLAAGVPRDPARVKAVLQDSADVLDEIPNKAGGNKYGAGLVNPYRALLPFANPEPVIALRSIGDNGTSYFGRVPFQVDMIGLKKMVALGKTVKVLLEKVGSTQKIEYVAGDQFDVPASKPGVFTSRQSVPRDTSLIQNLTPGLWKVSAIVGKNAAGFPNVTSSSFIEVKKKSFAKGLQLVSIPFKASGISDPAAKPETSLLGNTNFSLYRYNPYRGVNDKDYAQYASGTGSIADSAARLSVTLTGQPLSYELFAPATSTAPLGLGYWLNVGGDPIELQTTSLQTPGVDVVNPLAIDPVAVQLSEANGTWNMIGDPFLFPVSWSSVSVVAEGVTYTVEEAIKAKILGASLVGYGANGYEYNIGGTGTLEPFKGYWVSAKRPCTLIIPPSVADSTTRSISRSVRTTTVAGWKMRLAARVGSDVDQNYFGQQDGAQAGEDNYDIAKPPASPGGAYVRFIGQTGESKNRSYAADIKPLNGNSGAVEWVVAVTPTRSGQDVSLTWEGMNSLPRRGVLTLKDMATGKVVPMGNRSSYSFASGEAGSTRRFLITLTPQASAGPLAVTNIRVAPATRALGAPSGVSVRFVATQEAQIVGVVKTITGQTIGQMTGASRAASGSDTTLRWDGRNLQGASVPSGPYRIEVQARGTNGELVTFQRTIQNVR